MSNQSCYNKIRFKTSPEVFSYFGIVGEKMFLPSVREAEGFSALGSFDLLPTGATAKVSHQRRYLR
jgi:hypothetical protein